MRSMRYSGCGAGERENIEIAGPRFYESGALLEGNNLQAGAVSTRVMPGQPKLLRGKRASHKGKATPLYQCQQSKMYYSYHMYSKPARFTCRSTHAHGRRGDQGGSLAKSGRKRRSDMICKFNPLPLHQSRPLFAALAEDSALVCIFIRAHFSSRRKIVNTSKR
ncbi:hypothetical protein HDV57DRAFT_460931 [Trichoderma longibrachiatum]|uniref:Uncharacterized protein n=1 Tax=Trichoderma longibrachiatum ATCC 18648 TaxID=983965 RepID=A0A2T4C584_TRILO|nr:hypothetical protein M440DRAFT_301539 [Trichoderma longibrachiatum ATCC 18648]